MKYPVILKYSMPDGSLATEMVRLTGGTLIDELERQDKQFGMVTMCAAGGMAPAIIIERI